MRDKNDEYVRAMEAKGAQGARGRIGNATRERCQEAFSPGPRRTSEHEWQREESVPLIRRRARIREPGADVNETEFQGIKEKLTNINRQLQRLRKQQTEERRNQRLHDLVYVWKTEKVR